MFMADASDALPWLGLTSSIAFLTLRTLCDASPTSQVGLSLRMRML
jgi:hypothetical protein